MHGQLGGHLAAALAEERLAGDGREVVDEHLTIDQQARLASTGQAEAPRSVAVGDEGAADARRELAMGNLGRGRVDPERTTQPVVLTGERLTADFRACEVVRVQICQQVVVQDGQQAGQAAARLLGDLDVVAQPLVQGFVGGDHVVRGDLGGTAALRRGARGERADHGDVLETLGVQRQEAVVAQQYDGFGRRLARDVAGSAGRLSAVRAARGALDPRLEGADGAVQRRLGDLAAFDR